MQAFLQQYGQMIGFGILVLLLLRQSVDLSQIFGWARAGASAISSRMQPTQTTQLASGPIDEEAEALRATKFLLKYFATNNCKPGLSAAKTCGQHLLDHGDDVPAGG